MDLNTTSQSADVSGTSLSRAFMWSSLSCVLVCVGILGVFGVSLVPFALLSVTGVALCLAFRFPMIGLGAALAFMPMYPLTFLLAKFFGPPYVAWFEASDRVVILLFTFVLWRKNGVKLHLPDWLLLGCFGLALVHLAFSGSLIGLLSDFNFLIAYAAGRVALLSAEQQSRWAQRAVWIVAVLAVLGMIEVFIIGDGPRTVLYLAAANGGTQGQALDAAFHADQYFGLRESSTMFGPLQFAPLCMAGLVIWWVFCRNPIPAVMIAGGLICSLTRSAWIGTALAISVVAVLTGQLKRLFGYGLLALALFLAAIPVLGLSSYLSSTESGQDPSAQGHRASLMEGVGFIVGHPLGIGPGNVGKWAVKGESNAPGFEDTYLTIAGEYGIPALLCFVGFLVFSLRMVWRQASRVAHVAAGMVVGFGLVMMFAALHDVFPLACWLWFPVGLAIRASGEAGPHAFRRKLSLGNEL